MERIEVEINSVLFVTPQLIVLISQEWWRGKEARTQCSDWLFLKKLSGFKTRVFERSRY